jgi:ATP-binding cassette, subfamily F, member 3
LLGGRVTEGKGLSIGYFAQQEMDVLHEKSNALEHMVRLARTLGVDAREQELRSFLGQFRFEGDMAHQSVGTMSGGEKARLVLAMIVWQKPNLLLLDEPTNHLDLTTREALAMALNEYEGTVMLVSHDRALLRSVCDEFWWVEGGQVAPFDGDLEDYQKRVLELARAANAPKSIAKEVQGTPASSQKVVKTAPEASFGAPSKEQRKLDAQRRAAVSEKTKPWRQEIEKIDQAMTALGTEKTELEELLIRLTDGADIAMAGKRLKQIAEEITDHENRWLDLSERVERAQAELAA